MKIQGIIEAKTQSEGTSKSTGKPYIRYLFTINGKDYSTFNADIYNQRKVGEVVEMEGEQNGLFFNMKSMTEIGDVAIEVVKPGEKVAEKPSKQEFHLSIELCRIHALDCSIKHLELVSPQGSKNYQSEEILKDAEIYFAYIVQDSVKNA